MHLHIYMRFDIYPPFCMVRKLTNFLYMIVARPPAYPFLCLLPSLCALTVALASCPPCSCCAHIGTTETDQLHRMCTVLGTPTQELWPEGMQMAAKMRFRCGTAAHRCCALVLITDGTWRFADAAIFHPGEICLLSQALSSCTNDNQKCPNSGDTPCIACCIIPEVYP